MKRRGYGFLLLFLHILRAVTALEKIISKPGDNATLSCIYPKREFSLDSLRVYWQIATDEDSELCSVVHALISGQDNESLQCSQFKNRTQLLWDKLGDGDFSLLLFNVRQSDEHTYQCVVMQTTEYTRVIHQEQVVLSLADTEEMQNNGSSTGSHKDATKGGQGAQAAAVVLMLSPKKEECKAISMLTMNVLDTLIAKGKKGKESEELPFLPRTIICALLVQP
ncbi:hypothetical protein CIB84_001173 [Bambusicola thoracicus]|uniref:Ig-like domain-containing protein n=1 Tax=Bambusicola thoracicus TaxID=9083 RepID=A0A2P4TFD2_BAMTH|nr:hypothetical protein CIB84_001173 [Bambusicola thoracicus]